MKTRPDDQAMPTFDSNGMSASDMEFSEEGLTKREYFAAAAMQGILAWSPRGEDDALSVAESAALAVTAADLLIVELNETNKGKDDGK